MNRGSRAPDLLRWLQKTCSICFFFQRIASAAQSSPLSEWLLGTVQIQAVPNPTLQKPKRVRIKELDLKKILEAVDQKGLTLADVKPPLNHMAQNLNVNVNHNHSLGSSLGERFCQVPFNHQRY